MNTIGQLITVLMLLLSLPFSQGTPEPAMDGATSTSAIEPKIDAFRDAPTSLGISVTPSFTAKLSDTIEGEFSVNFELINTDEWDAIVFTVTEANDADVFYQPMDDIETMDIHREVVFHQQFTFQDISNLDNQITVSDLKLNYTYHLAIVRVNKFEKQDHITPFQIVDPYGKGSYLSIGKTYGYTTSPSLDSFAVSETIYEIEPNNTDAFSHVISEPCTIYGTLGNGDEVDAYSVVVPSSGYLLIYLSPQDCISSNISMVISKHDLCLGSRIVSESFPVLIELRKVQDTPITVYISSQSHVNPVQYKLQIASTNFEQ